MTIRQFSICQMGVIVLFLAGTLASIRTLVQAAHQQDVAVATIESLGAKVYFDWENPAAVLDRDGRPFGIYCKDCYSDRQLYEGTFWEDLFCRVDYIALDDHVDETLLYSAVADLRRLGSKAVVVERQLKSNPKVHRSVEGVLTLPACDRRPRVLRRARVHQISTVDP